MHGVLCKPSFSHDRLIFFFITDNAPLHLFVPLLTISTLSGGNVSKNWACMHIHTWQGSNKTTLSTDSQCERKYMAIRWCCAAHTSFLQPTHIFHSSLCCPGPVTLNWPWLRFAFSLPLTLDVLLLMSLWQYLDKAVADTSSKERHRGAVPQFLIYVQACALLNCPSVWDRFFLLWVGGGSEETKKRDEGAKEKNRRQKIIQSWQYDRKEQVIRAGMGNCRGVDSRSDLDSLICL